MRNVKYLSLLTLAVLLATSLSTSALPTATRDKAFFQGITYTWPINTPEAQRPAENKADLTQIATDPDQVIALLRTVYTDKTIPGTKVRGYSAANESSAETTYPVRYTGVGKIKAVTSGSGYEYDDAYGWNIPGNINRINNRYKDYTFQVDQYMPTDEGNTILLVEMQDGYSKSGNPESSVSDYSTLRALVASTIKSVRVLYEMKRTGTGTSKSGTLFKIDADHLTRFFLLGKGQCRWYRNQTTDGGVYNYGDPYYDEDGTYIDNSCGAIFYHMFEEFSPTIASNAPVTSNMYGQFVTGEGFKVVHDCPYVPYADNGHEFNMLAKDVDPENAPDVHDLMFFVPDYRLTDISSTNNGGYARDPNERQKYLYYNTNYAPTMEMYVIALHEIEGKDVSNITDGVSNHVYQLDLTWHSNLSDFFPESEQIYYLYRVVQGEDGNTVQQPVYKVNSVTGELITDDDGNPIPITIDPSKQETLTYTDYVKMETYGQQVTYVVKGQDVDKFLSLQTSNQESYLVPGYDKHERLTLRINADYYSHFEPSAGEVPNLGKNYYWNAIPMTNGVGTAVTANFLSDGNDGNDKEGNARKQSVFTFWRKLTAADDEQGTLIARATLTKKETVTENRVQKVRCTFNVEYFAQEEDDFEGNTKAKNLTTRYAYYTPKANADDEEPLVDFGDFIIYDNFSVSTATNEHPALYFYQVKFDAAEKFELIDGTLDNLVFSNKKRVDVHKTSSTIDGHFTFEQVRDDVDHNQIASEDIPGNITFSTVVKQSSKKEIERYNANKWIAGADDTPNLNTLFGYATNQDSYYQLWSRNNENAYVDAGTANVTSGQATADFTDLNMGDKATAYNYVPVIDVFPPEEASRETHNTYGAPILTAALGELKGEIVANTQEAPLMSEYTWKGDDGYTYAYYNIFVKLNAAQVPANYSIYKIRAWREVDESILGELLPTRAAVRMRGDYLFDEWTRPNDAQLKTKLGEDQVERGTIFAVDEREDNIRNELRATFGARKLRQSADETGVIDKLTAKMRVRMYFTRDENLPSSSQGARRRVAGKLIPDDHWYVAEWIDTFTIDANEEKVVTGVDTVDATREMAGVTYYNGLGQMSMRPFGGVNIVVTRYTDGTTDTAKVVY
ncbi:MAG: hypothetical protein IJ775_06150 [Muribaculaceae bacterium]|nr:hypothetical protein [Muribaculaceae bacterium]